MTSAAWLEPVPVLLLAFGCRLYPNVGAELIFTSVLVVDARARWRGFQAEHTPVKERDTVDRCW